MNRQTGTNLQIQNAPLRSTSEKFLSVAAIQEGTVIDHITQGQAMRLVRLLHLTKSNARITIGLNLPSAKMGFKDVIKVENRELTQTETNQIAIFSSQTTINIVSEYRVVKKFSVALPKTIAEVIICPNVRCITNHEPTHSLFYVKQHRNQTQLQCQYCEKVFHRDEIKEYTV